MTSVTKPPKLPPMNYLDMCRCVSRFVFLQRATRPNRSVRPAVNARKNIGCPITWLVAASNSCSPQLLGFALLIANVQHQLADQLIRRARTASYPHPSSPPLSVSWQRCLHNLYICLQTDPNMDLRVVRTQVQLCGDTTARGTLSAVQVDVPDIVDITAFLVSWFCCGPWLSPPPPRCWLACRRWRPLRWRACPRWQACHCWQACRRWQAGRCWQACRRFPNACTNDTAQHCPQTNSNQLRPLGHIGRTVATTTHWGRTRLCIRIGSRTRRGRPILSTCVVPTKLRLLLPLVYDSTRIPPPLTVFCFVLRRANDRTSITGSTVSSRNGSGLHRLAYRRKRNRLTPRSKSVWDTAAAATDPRSRRKRTIPPAPWASLSQNVDLEGPSPEGWPI